MKRKSVLIVFLTGIIVVGTAGVAMIVQGYDRPEAAEPLTRDYLAGNGSSRIFGVRHGPLYKAIPQMRGEWARTDYLDAERATNLIVAQSERLGVDPLINGLPEDAVASAYVGNGQRFVLFVAQGATLDLPGQGTVFTFAGSPFYGNFDEKRADLVGWNNRGIVVRIVGRVRPEVLDALLADGDFAALGIRRPT